MLYKLLIDRVLHVGAKGGIKGRIIAQYYYKPPQAGQKA